MLCRATELILVQLSICSVTHWNHFGQSIYAYRLNNEYGSKAWATETGKVLSVTMVQGGKHCGYGGADRNKDQNELGAFRLQSYVESDKYRLIVIPSHSDTVL